MNAGAIDFTFTPVTMKKGRPGLKVSVLVRDPHREAVSDYILEHSTAIGVRYYCVEREELQREVMSLDTQYGPIKAKRVTTPSGKTRVKAEYDDLKRTALANNVSIIQLKQDIEGNQS